ncbi:hypothetical protein FB459_2010 [Yimella lutea]|uniref:Uncharacterized protein n=1 Tax=Yimella lutea TaxID=587872 RepID=A0A542EGS7_9MICO|nr:hypothetical protein [Yimella lutea]TQJ14543.1 hypothetical protein FB459_2010 [Yimella lutea]
MQIAFAAPGIDEVVFDARRRFNGPSRLVVSDHVVWMIGTTVLHGFESTDDLGRIDGWQASASYGDGAVTVRRLFDVI